MHHVFYMLRIHPVINTVAFLVGVLILYIMRKRHNRIKTMLHTRDILCAHCNDLLSRILNDVHLQADPYHRDNKLNSVVYLIYRIDREASLVYDVKATDYMRSSIKLIEDVDSRIFRKQYTYNGGDHSWLYEMRGCLRRYNRIKHTKYS